MKYAVTPGEVFYERMLSATRTEAERATMHLLWRTGMHSSTLVEQDFELRGTYCHWKRTKKGKASKYLLRAVVTRPEANLIRRCLADGSLPKSQRALRWWVRRIGDRAGYAEHKVSPFTFRHSRAVWLRDGGMPSNRVAAMLGCSEKVVQDHYAQLEAERLV